MIYNIMKKIALISLISALSCSTLVHAGGMGDQLNTISGFASLEGGYTFNTIDNYNFTLIGLNSALTSTKSSQHYAGRLAAGVMFMMDDQFAMTSELGWGYYGRTTLKPAYIGFGDLSIENSINGFDALLGIAFVQPSYSLSLKAGALIQNVRTETTVNTTGLGFPLVDTYTLKSNQTGALPEIKLGGSYNFDNNWSITGAYIFALGTTQETNGTLDVNTFRSTLNSNTRNPTLNTILLGVQYTC